jgi:hypothetical protein
MVGQKEAVWNAAAGGSQRPKAVIATGLGGSPGVSVPLRGMSGADVQPHLRVMSIAQYPTIN